MKAFMSVRYQDSAGKKTEALVKENNCGSHEFFQFTRSIHAQ